MKHCPRAFAKSYPATARVCLAVLACLAVGGCAGAKRGGDHEAPVASVTVVYATGPDASSDAGPFRTQSDNAHFLEMKKFPEFTDLFRDAVVNAFAQAGVAASFQSVDTLPLSMTGFKTSHVLSLKVKRVRLTFGTVSGYIVYQASLTDVKLGQVIWEREESTGAGAFSTVDENRAQSLARRIVNQLNSDQLLPRKT